MLKLLFSVTKKDLTVQTFKSGGKGGQSQNKTDSGVRILHPLSGARGESRSERSQHVNKKIAFRRLAASKEFKLWQSRMVYNICRGKTVDEIVEETMKPENMKVEIIEEGKWIETEK